MKQAHSFAWLNATQFLGALNDNTFKLLTIFFLIGSSAAGTAGSVVATVGTVFVLPFLLFSHLGGALADRISKRTVIVATKLAEVLIMMIGWFAFQRENTAGLYAACFLMSTQSALFGPSKYGILPEIVERERLAKANGRLLAFTFMAVVIGTPLAALLAEAASSRLELAARFCIVLATLGAVTSFGISHTPAAGDRRDVSPIFIREIVRTLKEVRSDGYLFLTIISSACFLMLAAFVQLNIIPYGMEVLSWSEERSSYLFVLAAIGIGLSAMLASRYSGRNIEFGLVPLGALGLAITSIMLYLGASRLVVAAGIMLAGISVGFFTVPLDAFLQLRSPRKQLGRILAASNFLGYVGVLAAAVLIYLTESVLGLSAAQGFLVLAAFTIVLTVFSIIVLPDFFVRFIIVLITRTFYRIKPVGLGNLPLDGGALLVSNHMSLVDALLVSATQQRRIRFVMFRETYEHCWWFRPLFKLMRAIPISPKDPPRKLLSSLKEARRMLDEGYLVCIFAEGAVSRGGNTMGFKSGLERIVKRSNYPIIPVYLGGVWGSIFSYCSGKPLSTLPRRIPYPVTVLFGKPMPSDSTPFEIRQAVCELSTDWFFTRKNSYRPLGELFVRSARRHRRRHAMSDTTGKNLNYGKALIAATVLSDRFKKLCGDQKMVGIMMPATVAGALANIAITMLGKVPVNLNFTSSRKSLLYSIEQCGIRTIISSKAFLAKLKDFEPPEGTIFLEDISASITGRAKVIALLKSIMLPAGMLANSKGYKPDDLATVIFSSGTTGEPKGVMLSHFNIVSNMESFGMVLWFTADDNMCAALPFFHSFGFTCTLWFPLITGFSVCYHPNPLEGDKIAEIVRTHHSAILLATPTFLLQYIRRADKDDFHTLRYVITGAEKLRVRVAEAFEKKFGLAPLEGYGVTETTPVVSVNVPDIDTGRSIQLGTKKGTIGRAVPGVSVKIVDSITSRLLPPGEEGLLMVRGPNVMLGYLNQPERTAEVLKDGWYNTGDIAKMDEEGFTTITDRASRFSKIGGEMVPHIALEEVYLKPLDAEGRVVVVTSVADEARGERLVVLFTDEAGTAEQLHEIMNDSELPNLWKPRLDDYVKVDAIPVTGSGKIDLKAVKQLAAEIVCW